MTDLASFQPNLQEATHALTVWQPWASLIILGFKPYEFRRWPAPKSFAGRRIAIHAARRTWDAEELRAIAGNPERTCFGGNTERAREFAISILGGALTLPLGAILGTVTLGEPRRAIDLACATCDPDDIDPDVWAWPVFAPQQFSQPVPARGRQGFWRLPIDERSGTSCNCRVARRFSITRQNGKRFASVPELLV